MVKKRVAIIGGGASGLSGAHAMEQRGLEPVIFEMQDYVGGMWKYQDSENYATVYRSTVINTAKEVMCFSDYPIPNELPTFMHNERLFTYFNDYAEHFNLRRYVRFNHKVLSVEKHPDHSSNGKWILRYVEQPFKFIKIENETAIPPTQDEIDRSRLEEFDAVLVCSGHHWLPWDHRSLFPGQEKFKGQIIHSHSYKRPNAFKDKRVIILGIGNSGVDISVDVSQQASQTYIATRSGTWLIHRIAPNGVPLGLESSRLRGLLTPAVLQLSSVYKNHAYRYGDLENFGLKPKHDIHQAHPTVKDDLILRVVNGSLVVKPNIAEFTENTVKFVDGTEVEVDVVIMAIGYKISYPFLDEKVFTCKDNVPSPLYKYVWPAQNDVKNLAIIGLFQPLGAINPAAELQSRWAARVFNGELKLPSEREMLKDCELVKREQEKRYLTRKRHTIQVDGLPYQDLLAKEAGVYPNFTKWFFKDPKFWWFLMTKMAPLNPVQYRLDGPNAWPGAKQAIIDMTNATWLPFRTRKTNYPPSAFQRFFVRLKLVTVILMLAAAYFMFGDRVRELIMGLTKK